MQFFDYLYLFIYNFYVSYREKGAEASSAGIVGGLQAFNVLTVIMLVQSFNKEKAGMSKVVVIVLFIIFQVTTYIRYIYREKHSVSAIESKWLSKTELSRKQTSSYIYLYGALSIIIGFGLAIYLGSRK
jgi:hypothetical protein